MQGETEQIETRLNDLTVNELDERQGETEYQRQSRCNTLIVHGRAARQVETEQQRK